MAATVEAILEEAGYPLPEPPPKLGNYVGAVTVGNVVYVSGHAPWEGQELLTGKLGREVSIEQGQHAARVVILNCLASLKAEIEDLSRVKRIVKLLGMVNCTDDFVETPAVIDGASDLLVQVFGDKGQHARSAVGFASLPKGISVEIEVIVELHT